MTTLDESQNAYEARAGISSFLLYLYYTLMNKIYQ